MLAVINSIKDNFGNALYQIIPRLYFLNKTACHEKQDSNFKFAFTDRL